MPEIAEVALTAEILEKYLKKKTLISFEFINGRYLRKSPDRYQDFVENLPLKVGKVDSRGKFLWFELYEPKNKMNKWYIWNTFGLTGMWSVNLNQNDMQPKYIKAVLTFSNVVVYFSDMRNFGTFKFSKDSKALEKKLQTLSPDFLKDDFDLSEIRNYKMPIVKILMDQKKIGSGIGNYLVAEILYRAKISPHRLGSELSNRDIKCLTYWIKYIIKLSYIDNDIGYMVNLAKEASQIIRRPYHPDIKLKEKKFRFLVYKQKIDPIGNKVKAEKIINGRTTYWVPAVQI